MSENSPNYTFPMYLSEEKKKERSFFALSKFLCYLTAAVISLYIASYNEQKQVGKKALVINLDTL